MAVAPYLADTSAWAGNLQRSLHALERLDTEQRDWDRAEVARQQAADVVQPLRLVRKLRRRDLRPA